MEHTFEPMEWAVLVNSVGGRLFQVAGFERVSEDCLRVVEYHVPRFGEAKHDFSVPVEHLIKCKDKKTAEFAVSILRNAYEDYQNRIRAAQREQESGLERLANELRRGCNK